MKKIFFAVVLAVMFWAVDDNVYSQCPSGFSGPYTTIISLCGSSCLVEVEWCCFSGINPTVLPSISFNKIRFLTDPLLPGSGCSCLNSVPYPGYQSPIPMIPASALFSGIFVSGQGCFSWVPSLPPCDQTTMQILITAGGCFKWISSSEFIGYKKCSDSEEGYCQQSFSVCMEYVAPNWILKTISDGPPVAQFECNDGCHPLCGLIIE